jgi:hypothetical protein
LKSMGGMTAHFQVRKPTFFFYFSPDNCMSPVPGPPFSYP